jgi:hypothetical protein
MRRASESAQIESTATRAGVGGTNRLVELPAQIRNQVRDELKRLLMQFAAGAEMEVNDDDAEH